MDKLTHLSRESSRSFTDRLRIGLFHAAGRMALYLFERRTWQAGQVNRRALNHVLTLNRDSKFGITHKFECITSNDDFISQFKASVPLSTFANYEHFIDRIADGEENILTTDPIHILAASSGTTGRPKRIPRTRRAQRHHMMLIVLANQAVVQHGIARVNAAERGINLMSLYAPPTTNDSSIPVMSGPNAGLARLRKQIPLLWSSPVSVYCVSHRATALYLHALFGLLNRRALYIEMPFAPHVVGWFSIMERFQEQLVQDIRTGKLSSHLKLSSDERREIERYLHAEPERAEEIAAEFNEGFEAIAPRLWPNMKYIRTVTTGSFAVSLPRLRWLAGSNLLIHSSGHSSSEGIIGVNLSTDEKNQYVLAVGSAYFEFIPTANRLEDQPKTLDLHELEVGHEYEIVLTSSAGLYRYRLGDVVRITGFHGTAPTYEYLYRCGTILNHVGEKTTESHTSQALLTVMHRCTGSHQAVKDYSVAFRLGDGLGRYTFFVELNDDVMMSSEDLEKANDLLDQTLCEVSPSYLGNGRDTERLEPAKLALVQAGTFEAMIDLQLSRAKNLNQSQVKIPRVINSVEQLELLESRTILSQTNTDFLLRTA